jgi:hypothetical protein
MVLIISLMRGDARKARVEAAPLSIFHGLVSNRPSRSVNT